MCLAGLNGLIRATPEHKGSTVGTGLDPERVHLIRTSGKPDRYYATLWCMTDQAIRKARTGITWENHPTPPDTAPRVKRGSWGELAY